MQSYIVTFINPFGNEEDFLINIEENNSSKETIEYSLFKTIKPFLRENYMNLLYSDTEELIKEYGNEKTAAKMIWRRNNPVYKCIDVKKVKCYGCVNDCPDQRSHMDIGGCLYDYYDSE